MIYTVEIKERYYQEERGITLTFHALEDVMNLVGLVTEGRTEYHSVEIKITAEPDPNLAKVESVD
jgi:hypothetical protein